MGSWDVSYAWDAQTGNSSASIIAYNTTRPPRPRQLTEPFGSIHGQTNNVCLNHDMIMETEKKVLGSLGVSIDADHACAIGWFVMNHHHHHHHTDYPYRAW
jgi:hypothetical protein